MNVWVVPVTMTSDDHSIIETVYAIDNPRKLPDLLPLVPSDSEVVDVEAVYDVTAPTKAHYIDCAACNRKRNHTHGFVVRFANGKRATIGRTCADKRHQLEYERYLSAFDDKRSRVRHLREVLAMHETSCDFRACLDQLKVTDIITLRELRKNFRANYWDIATELAKYPDGKIYGLVRKRNLDAERARDQRREKKIRELANQLNKKEDDIDQNTIRSHFSGDKDFKRSPIYMDVNEPVANYIGTGFVSGLPHFEEHIFNIIGRAENALSLVSGKLSCDLSIQCMKSATRRYRQCIEDTIAMAQSLEEAHLFVSARNLSAIARHFNSIKGFSERGSFSISGSTIIRTKAGLPLRKLDMTLPQPAPIQAALGRLLAILDDRLDDAKSMKVA